MAQAKPDQPVSETSLATAIGLDTGEQQELSVRRGSPTLDADFYDSVTGTKLKNSGDRRAAHHTQTSTSKARIYEWNFRTELLRLKVTIHYTIDVSDAIQLSDSITVDVYRNGRRVD